MRQGAGVVLMAGLAAGCACGGARAQATFPEVEPNESKASASGPFVLAHGDRVTGLSTSGSTSGPSPANADSFLLRSAPLAPGIYRHRMVLTTDTGTGLVGTIRGLNQSSEGIGTTDSTVQTSGASTSPPHLVQWYGFGRQEEVYYRVGGAVATTAEYAATMDVTPVAAAAVPGHFAAGPIAISTQNQGHTSDTELWVYDAEFNALPGYGNDDSTGGMSPLNSHLVRGFDAGIYYLAISNDNLALSLPSPADDHNHVGVRLDFPDAAANSSAAAGHNLSFSITDSGGSPVQVAASKAGPFEVNWFSFEVVGTSLTGACCTEGDCAPATAFQCAVGGGAYRGDGTDCATAPCDSGACCFHDGTCEVLTRENCDAVGGVYEGDLSLCAECPPGGACCLPDGTCGSYTAEFCLGTGGVWNGAGSGCDACPTGGACCMGDGLCVPASPPACASGNGMFIGPGALCEATACGPGACCMPDLTCSQYIMAQCIGSGGVYAGEGTSCDDDCPRFYAYAGGALAIPDGAGDTICGAAAAAEIVVTDSFPVADLEAAFHVMHGWQGDVRVSLRKDGGPPIFLVDRPGRFPGSVSPLYGYGEDNFGTSEFDLFRSVGVAPLRYQRPDQGGLEGPGILNVSGPWRPEHPLTPLLGVDSAGTWRLEVYDCALTFTGTLHSFRLALREGPAAAPCYVNCDGSTGVPFLNVADFTCFLQRFAAGDGYANCDGSTNDPTLNVADFTCFLQAFAAGCSAP